MTSHSIDELAVHRMFERSAWATPMAPAVEYLGEQMTYAQLAAAAGDLAARIAESCPRGSTVAVAADRSFHLPIAVLATLYAGCAYLPIDRGYPRDRIDFMLHDSGARLLLTQRDAVAGMTIPDGTRVLLLDEQADPPHEPPAGPVAVTPDDLVYVIYTSGSTGIPKAVGMPHGPMTGLIAWTRATSDSDAQSRTLQFSAASFDASFHEMFSTWASGGCLVLIDEDARRDAHRLLRFVDEHRINRMFMPFVALQAMATAADGQDLFPQTLREILTGGEQLFITPMVRQFFRRIPAARLENVYGPSETQVVTSYRLTGDPAQWEDLPPVGRPIDHATILLIGDDGEPVPAGATGEIAIGGPVIARGYLNRPAPTAERFVPDPAAVGGRLYRSGDVGFLDDAGQLRFLGRSDDQVKIRGYRIELGEVEIAVKSAPGLLDAVVVVNADQPEAKRLVAYVRTTATSPDTGTDAAIDDIRRHVASILPDYMIPTAFVVVDSFPLTPSGKVDRRSLTERPLVISGGAEQARDQHEHELLELWRQTVNAVNIGVHDNFFALGGNSLLAVVLLTKVNMAFDVNITLDTLLRMPTVAEIAAWIRTQPSEPEAVTA